MASKADFDTQFDLMARSIDTGLDMYAYATFTSPTSTDLPQKMESFIDRLQAISLNLPLRTVPLEVQVFTPTAGRIRPEHLKALGIQKAAVVEWDKQMSLRFSSSQRSACVCDVPLGQFPRSRDPDGVCAIKIRSGWACSLGKGFAARRAPAGCNLVF